MLTLQSSASRQLPIRFFPTLSNGLPGTVLVGCSSGPSRPPFLSRGLHRPPSQTVPLSAAILSASHHSRPSSLPLPSRFCCREQCLARQQPFLPTRSSSRIASLVEALTGASFLPSLPQKTEAQPQVVRTEQAVGWATSLDQSDEERSLQNGMPGAAGSLPLGIYRR